MRGLLGAVALVLVVALIAAGIAVVQGGHARRSATVALSQSLGAQAVAETQLDTALLLAEEGVNLDDSLRTESDLLAVLLHSPSAIGVLHVGRVGASPNNVTVSPDGHTLAIINRDETLWFYDASTRRPIGRPVRDVPVSGYTIPAFTPDGSELAILRGPLVQFIDVRTHRVMRTLRVGQSAQDDGSPVLISADGRTLDLQMGPGVVSWDVSTGRRIASADVPGLGVQMLALAQRAGQIVDLTTEGGGRIQVRDGRTLAVDRSFPVPLPGLQDFGPSYSLAVSSGGRAAAYGTNSGSDIALRFVDLRTGAVTVGSGAQAGGGFVAVSPDGRTAMSVTSDYLHVSIWDVASSTLVQTLTGHSGAIEGAAFDPSGHTLYTAGDDGNVFEWDLAGGRAFGRSFVASPGSFERNGIGHHYPYFSGSRDGDIAVAYAPQHFSSTGSSRGGDVNVLDAATGRVVTHVRVAGAVPGVASVSYAELSPDGTELLVSPGPSSNGDVTLWRLDHGQPSLLRTFSGVSASPVRSDENGVATGFWNAPWATLSRDGKWIAGVDRTEDGHSHVIEWNADTGARRAPPLDLRWHETEGGVSENVVYSPDGSLLATSVLGDRIAVIDASTLKVVRMLRDPHGVAFVAFSPTNHSLLAETSSGAGLLRLWDLSTGQQVAETTMSTSACDCGSGVQFDPSGRTLVTATADAAARLWSVPDLHQIGTDLPGLPSALGSAGFTGTGDRTMAVIVYGLGKAYSYPASAGAWERQACLVAGRNFTKAEWARYVGDRPYQDVCPQYPPGS